MASTDDKKPRNTIPGQPPVAGGIPEVSEEDMTAAGRRGPPSREEPTSDAAVIERAGQLAREAQARNEDGQKVFEDTLAAAGVTLPDDEAPRCPPGYAMFRNTSALDTVKVTLMDGNNRPRTAKVKPLRFEVFPIEYAHLIPSRAPQLKEVSRTPAEADDA